MTLIWAIEREIKIFCTGSYHISETLAELTDIINEDNTIILQYVKNCSNYFKNIS